MYYTLAKTAELLELQPADVNRLREQGKLRAFKDGADWKFREEEVKQYLAKMIKERSGLLSSENDDESASDVDSSIYDAMFDQAGDAFQTTPSAGGSDPSFDLSAAEGEVDVANLVDDEPSSMAFDLKDKKQDSPEDLLVSDVPDEDDDLKLADDGGDDLKLADDGGDDLKLAGDDDLKLADDGGDDLKLADEAPENALVKEGDSPLTSEDSALAEDPAAVDLTSASGSGSGDGLTLGSDSGLSLLDEVGGSNVDLAGDDLILGGSSGSGSGDGMSLGSDSGLSLMDDAEGAFELSAGVSEQGELDLAEPKKDDEDDSVFSLEGETPSSNPQILNLDQNADSEAPTELAADESVFELSTQTTDAPLASDSKSSTNFMKDDAPSETLNPFVTDDGEDEGDSDIFSIADEQPTVNEASASRSIDILDDVSTDSTADPFTSDGSSDSPFADAESTVAFTPSSEASPFGGGAFDGSATDAFGNSDGFDSSSDFGGSNFTETETTMATSGISSMQFTGKDLIFLVPCLIFLLLATIGALELVRTIWSYQEGTFDIGGPLLETIAKMVKLM